VILLKKDYLLLLFIILFSIIMYQINLVVPGGDSIYYYYYSDEVSSYFDKSRYLGSYSGDVSRETMSLINNSVSSASGDPFSQYSLFSETYSYILISGIINYLIGSHYGIILFQTLLTFMAYLSIKRTLKFFEVKKFIINHLYLFVSPLLYLAIVPNKEAITVFLITLLYEFFIKKRVKLFILFVFLLFLYRWNFIPFLLFILFNQYIIFRLLSVKAKKLLKIIYLLSVTLIIFKLSPMLLEIAGTGYDSFSMKNLTSTFVFPILKIKIYDTYTLNNVFFLIWNNVYSVLWYLFLPGLFLSFVSKDKKVKSLGMSILLLLFLLGMISAGMQSDRLKISFIVFFLIIGSKVFYEFKKTYLIIFMILFSVNIFLMLINFDKYFV